MLSPFFRTPTPTLGAFAAKVALACLVAIEFLWRIISKGLLGFGHVMSLINFSLVYLITAPLCLLIYSLSRPPASVTTFSIEPETPPTRDELSRMYGS